MNYVLKLRVEEPVFATDLPEVNDVLIEGALNSSSSVLNLRDSSSFSSSSSEKSNSVMNLRSCSSSISFATTSSKSSKNPVGGIA